MIASVRRFNRTVTQRVGALDDHYFSRDYPLGVARLLWEIGDGGCEVRVLRSRLDLDSGYLSRLLRSLETQGLVTVTASDADKRVRIVRLTAAGRSEWSLLDKESDALALSMLGPLTAAQRDRLVAAMREVTDLLTAASVEITAVDPGGRDARYCLDTYCAELDARFSDGFDPGTTRPAEPDDMRPPAGTFLLASLKDEPVGCAGLILRGSGIAEFKRMWVAPRARGLGVGCRLLGALESAAAEKGCHTARLDTNASLTEAIALYLSAGYVEVAAFNDEPYADHWFEKRLSRARPRGGKRA